MVPQNRCLGGGGRRDMLMYLFCQFFRFLAQVGYEFLFPIHSPLITRIQVLKRGFIGRNKNACAAQMDMEDAKFCYHLSN